jgi:hypothetical protein
MLPVAKSGIVVAETRVYFASTWCCQAMIDLAKKNGACPALENIQNKLLDD